MKELNEVQKKLLEMLSFFDSYCQENNITYYVAGGTLLGAMRHQGFIPWDDDIDVVVPRPDYEKLMKSFSDKEGKYILESPYDGNDDFLFTYSKLYDRTTTVSENVRPICTRGLYIDIFPLDGIGDDDWVNNYKQFDRLNMLMMTRTCSVRKGRGFAKNCSIILMRLVPQFILNNKKLSIKLDKKASKFSYENSKYAGNLMGAYRYKEIMEKHIFGKPVRLKYEDIYVNAPEKSVEYLKHIYGKWGELPPENKRGGAHSYLSLDLNTPYK